MENYHLSIHMAFWKESMINRLSNLINRNRLAAKISQGLCSSNYPVHALVSTIVEFTYRRPFSSVEKLMNLQEGGFGLIFVTNSSMSALLGP